MLLQAALALKILLLVHGELGREDLNIGSIHIDFTVHRSTSLTHTAACDCVNVST